MSGCPSASARDGNSADRVGVRMALRWLLGTALYAFAALSAADSKKPELEPRLLSIYPVTIAVGQSADAVIRGIAIEDAGLILSSTPGLSATVRGIQAEPADVDSKPGAPPTFSLQVHIL